MAHETEAACLLRSGANYPSRLGLVSGDSPPIFVGFRAGAASLYFGDDPIFHFDREGRWQRAFVDGVHYLKGLDATTRVLDRVREGENLVLRRRTLSFAEASDLDAAARSAALEVSSGLDGRFESILPPSPARPIDKTELSHFLDRVASWDAAAWFAHRERYLGLYGPPPFVPPDAASAVLLQATLGNFRSPFGGAPASEPYRRSPAEFEAHAASVAALWGRRLDQAKHVYLAGGEVWHEPTDEIRRYLDILARTFPDRSAIGFLDDVSDPLPDRAGWVQLREAGLSGLTLGVESGDREIRRRFGKTWDDGDLRRLVSDLDAASIACRIVVLVGFDGIEATATLLESLPLPRKSIVYLIDASEVASDSSDGTSKAASEEIAWLKARIGSTLKEKGVMLVPYSLDKQWN